MKKSIQGGCLVILWAALFACPARGQRTEYHEVFAPSQSWVRDEEKPYRQDLCLNGLWEFQPVSLPASFREGTDKTPPLPDARPDRWEAVPIRIPSPWNVNSFADREGQGGDFRCFPSYPRSWETSKMGWLRKKFRVPEHWKGQRLQLHFEAVAGDAEILVNGKTVGKHFGIFLPFDVDITDAVIPGRENELRVGIRKASLFDHRGEYGRRTYQAGSFWGQHIAGIWQDVYLVAVPRVRVSDVFVQPRVEAGELKAELTLVNDQDTDVVVSLDGRVFPWRPQGRGAHQKPVLGIPAVSVRIPARGTAQAVLSAPVQGALRLWSPETPHLYGLTLQLGQQGAWVDHKYTRFGWRQVTLRGDRFLLNGEERVLRGDSWHFLGIPQMTRRYASAWYQAMRDAGLNAVRLHAQPYPSFYLDVADEMGILVLDETAVWASDGGTKVDDPAYWQDSKTHLKELILRDRNHPSVFGWSVSNEVMPVVREVMHNPPGVKDTLVKYYGLWAALCRQLDPTRSWISADGENDGEGLLPVYLVHYGGREAMDRARQSGKPWGVGEAGNAYYGTPQQVSQTNGDRAYESFLGRMEGVAASSYQSLVDQRERKAVYQSVFNMVWYGLQPLPLGLKDPKKPPTLEDGIHFTHVGEGLPGVQPERLGPYCTTLNPGYDRSLPLYRTWPLFEAIRDAATGRPASGKWIAEKPVIPQRAAVPPVASVSLVGGRGSTLQAGLKQTGVLFRKAPEVTVPSLLFVDGACPPAADQRALIQKVGDSGGTVVVWGVSTEGLAALNDLLPAPLEITDRAASSLSKGAPDVLTEGLSAADLYFSELRPPLILNRGLDGPLVQQSKILLSACETDWLKWNKQPEYAKTGMVFRSEQEGKPSGVALITGKLGKGRLVVTTLPAAPRLAKMEKAVRMVLENLGAPLGPGSDAGKPLLKNGEIVRVLYSGSYPVSSLKEGAATHFIDPMNTVQEGERSSGSPWTPLHEESGLMDLLKINTDGPRSNAVAYLSFWVLSPRPLDDLLVEPDVPVVNMEVAADDAVQVWLNGMRIIQNIRTGDLQGGQAKAMGLRLHQGWNHFLIKVIQEGGEWQFSGRLTCNQPDFLAALESALEKPR